MEKTGIIRCTICFQGGYFLHVAFLADIEKIVATVSKPSLLLATPALKIDKVEL
jgi:hypothetical protein